MIEPKKGPGIILCEAAELPWPPNVMCDPSILLLHLEVSYVSLLLLWLSLILLKEEKTELLYEIFCCPAQKGPLQQLPKLPARRKKIHVQR